MSAQSSRVVVVTGASQGIGLVVAERFLQAGDCVAGCALPSVSPSPQLRALLEKYPRHFHFFPLDVTDPDAISTFAESVTSRFGNADVLVSNAGKNVFEGIDCPLSAWQHNVDLNLRSHWLMANAFKPALRSQQGVIIVMTSNHAFSTLPGCAPYNIAKRALLSLVQSLTIEWGPAIRAVGVAPGFIDTEGNQAWFDSHPDPQQARASTIKKHPVGRIGTPQEVGALCYFLASKEAGFIAGTTLVMDGGRSALMQDD